MSISVITATYNAENTLMQCLQSVGGQTILPQHIIIDGSSSDSTLQIVDGYQGHVIDVSSERDDGIYDAMNKGISKAQGDIVGILNADDFYADSAVLETVEDVFKQNDIDVCYGNLCYVAYDNTAKIVRYWQSGAYDHRKLYWGWMPPHPTFFVRKSVYKRCGMFDPAMGSAADYELMLRLLLRYELKAGYIPRVLVNMRTGGISNASLKNRIAANRMDRHAWRVNGLTPLPWTLACKPLRKVGQWLVKPGKSA